MIWFNIKELEKRLIEGKFSDKLILNYLLTHLILTAISGLATDDEPLWMIWIQFIVGLIAVIWLVRKTFEINQEGDNRDYFKRIISLSFVAGIRTIVFMIPVLLGINILVEVLQVTGVGGGMSDFQENLMLTCVYLLSTGLFCYILLHSFQRINAAGESADGFIERNTETGLESH